MNRSIVALVFSALALAGCASQSVRQSAVPVADLRLASDEAIVVLKNTPGWSTTWISGLSVDGVFHPAASSNIQTFNTTAHELYSVVRVKAADYFLYAIEGHGKTWSARCPYEFAYIRLSPGQVYYMGAWTFTFDPTIGKPNWKWENEMSDAQQYVSVKFHQTVSLTMPPSRKSHLLATEEAKCPAGTTLNKPGTGV